MVIRKVSGDWILVIIVACPSFSCEAVHEIVERGVFSSLPMSGTEHLGNVDGPRSTKRLKQKDGMPDKGPGFVHCSATLRLGSQIFERGAAPPT